MFIYYFCNSCFFHYYAIPRRVKLYIIKIPVGLMARRYRNGTEKIRRLKQFHRRCCRRSRIRSSYVERGRIRREAASAMSVSKSYMRVFTKIILNIVFQTKIGQERCAVAKEYLRLLVYCVGVSYDRR